MRCFTSRTVQGQFDGLEVTEPVLDGDYWRATATVYRKDMSRPFVYPGRYPVKGRNKDYGPEMAIKVAEVMALRRAFDVSAPIVEERWDRDMPEAPVQPPPATCASGWRRSATCWRPTTSRPTCARASTWAR